MAIRDVFLPLLSYPEPTGADTIELVIDLAENLSKPSECANAGAHRQIHTRISALILETEIEPGLYFEGGHIGEFLEAEARKSVANAQNLVASFRKLTIDRPILAKWRIEKRNPYQGLRLMAQEARLHNMTVLPIGKDNENHQEIAEHLIFETGRPVLIFPERPVRTLSKTFQNIAVAWDGSRPAARAVADAMPFLRRASHVHIFSATDDKPIPEAHRGSEIAELLKFEGVNAIYEGIKQTNQHNIGNFMECYVADRGCDLLVMGAFGHSRIRQFILGSETQNILMNPPCWVMLSH